MKLLDEQMAELEKIDIEQTKQPDFDDFWEETVGLARKQPLNIEYEVIDHPVDKVEVRDLTFEGLDGTKVSAWLLLPPEAREDAVPALVHYHGATGSRGVPGDFMSWLMMGVAVVSMDFRMQGGLTGSNTGFMSGAGQSSFITAGLMDKKAYYFFHAWTDCLRAIEVALDTEEIDSNRVGVGGGSQGGAASWAMASLHPEVVLSFADVPSSSWLEKRVFDRQGGYGKISEFIRRHPDQMDTVMETLSYYDNINLVDRITCPVMVSAGFKDPVCPIENVFASYNKITSPKEIHVYPFGEHDGGREMHSEKNLQFVKNHFFG